MMDKFLVQKVKDAANIVDVVGDFVELRKKGVSYWGYCPFHADKHLGSFMVSEQKNICKCFSCNCNGKGALGPIDFLMQHENLSFVDAIKWLAHKYSIIIPGESESDKKRWANMKHANPHTPRTQLPTLEIEPCYVDRKKGSNNNLCNWIRQLPWTEEQAARIEQAFVNYMMGTSAQGHAIFWQVDEQGKVRTAKMMKYKTDGHRDKNAAYSFGWIHASMAKYKLIDLSKYEMRQTLFGMHLTGMVPGATINIVESEKTAILCAISYGRMDKSLWLACGGKANLTKEKLRPLIEQKRDIILYPDYDGIEEWKEIAEGIGYDRLYVATEFVKQNWRPDDGEKADIADILVRLMTNNITDLKQVARNCPPIKILSDRLNLEIVKVIK